MNEHIYRVEVTREGDSWLADVVSLEGAHTWAKSLSALDRNVREVIGMIEDLPRSHEAQLELNYAYNIGGQLGEEAAAVATQRKRIEQETRELAQRTAFIATALVDESGVSKRDIAIILDLSPQRISQVTTDRKPSTPRITAKAARRLKRTAGRRRSSKAQKSTEDSREVM